MLRFKRDESLSTAIKHFSYAIKNTLNGVTEDVLLGDELNLSNELKNKILVVIQRWNDDFKETVIELSQSISDESFDSEFVVFILNSEYSSKIKDLINELYHLNSDENYYQGLSLIGQVLTSIDVLEFINQSRDGQSERLERLLEVKRLSAWRAAFKKEEWSEAQLIHEIRNGISDVVADVIKSVYYEGISTNELISRSRDTVMNAIHEEFFEEYLADSLRTEVNIRIEPGESAKELLGTVNDVIEYTEKRLNKRVEAVTSEKIDELHEVLYDEING